MPGGDGRNEGLFRGKALEGVLEVVDVLLHQFLAAVSDGAGADDSADGGSTNVTVVLLVEIEEALAVAVGVAHGLLFGSVGVGLETGETVMDVVGEAGLGELAVAGHIDASLALAADDALDGVADQRSELLGVIVLTGLLGAHDVDDLLRARKGADVGGQDTRGAVFHSEPPRI